MAKTIAERVERLDWIGIEEQLSTIGYALTGPVLTKAECDELVSSYKDDAKFRSHIIMKRYRFGSGDYKYYARPLPSLVEDLRRQIYPRLAPLANAWNEAMGI